MTGFEQATLTLQHVALWISAVAAAANVIAAAGIWHGIRAMVRANKDRAVILDGQREADDKRHEDAMKEGARRHEEAMNEIAARRKADDKRHEDAMAAHAEAMAEGVRRHEEAMKEGARRHEEAMKEGARRHEEALKEIAARREADDKRHEDAMAAHAEAMAEGARRHEEAMAALAAQREADERRHEEAMAAHAAQGRSLDALIGGLERQIVSLESVVERTGPLRMGFEEPDPGPAE